MAHDTEVRHVARIIAESLGSKNIMYPRGSKQLNDYVEAMWPAYSETAQDVIIFLLGDEYQLDEVVNHEKDGNGSTPFVVCSTPDCSSEG